MKNELCGYLVIHQHDKKDWRLRNTEKHPIDPNWETGTYCKCHKKLRTSPNAKHGLHIFDVVRIPDYSYPCVRSAFLVEESDGEKLYFDSFLFADKEPLEITPKIIPTIKPGLTRTNPGKKLILKECKKLWKELEKKSTKKYKKGEKPSSISSKDWRTMKIAANKSMSRSHRCGFDKKNFIPIKVILKN